MNIASLTELAHRLTNPESLITDISDYKNYCKDATNDSGIPAALVFAENESDVVATAGYCFDNKLSLVPRGAGTGLSGGCVPSENSLVLSTERMCNLIIDEDSKIAYAGPGVITKTLLDEAQKLGLTYPPDPASYEESTLGGNVAENAGGLRCKRFGVTKDYVIGLKGVTINGEIIKTGTYNQNQGFTIGDVIIGSEGTLIIITEMAFRLIALPAAGDTMLIAFNNPGDAALSVSDITCAGIIPTVLEYLDGDAAECSNKYEKTEGLDNVAAILLIETPEDDKNNISSAISDICKKNDCTFIRTENNPEKVEQLWKIRRNLSKAVKEIAELRVSEDVAVPNSQFPVLVDFVATMNKNNSMRINSFGHAGDGNLHVNFLAVDDNEKDFKLMEENINTLLNKAVELGGTLSGEHGIGLAKRKYLPLEFDKNTISYMKIFKDIFDPFSLMNPGKIFS
ncbi:MAG: FAD-binding oxidoreductase [Candidatus Zixiibacteriota bacterium]